MDCSPPGCSVHGILQARVLEWGAIASIVVAKFLLSEKCKIKGTVCGVNFIIKKNKNI